MKQQKHLSPLSLGIYFLGKQSLFNIHTHSNKALYLHKFMVNNKNYVVKNKKECYIKWGTGNLLGFAWFPPQFSVKHIGH